LVSRAARDLLEIADGAAQIAGPDYEAYLLTRRRVGDWLWKHLRIQLPTSCPEGALFRTVALGIMPSAP
jgi:hypothetical protein